MCKLLRKVKHNQAELQWLDERASDLFVELEGEQMQVYNEIMSKYYAWKHTRNHVQGKPVKTATREVDKAVEITTRATPVNTATRGVDKPVETATTLVNTATRVVDTPTKDNAQNQQTLSLTLSQRGT